MCNPNYPAIHTVARPTRYSSIILDSGATNTFIRESDSHDTRNLTRSPTPLKFSLSNGATLTSTAQAEMIVHPRLPVIPCYLFKDTDLQHSLIAISDLCDIGCTIVSTAKETSITHPTLTDPIYRITADATSRLLHITPAPMHPPAGLNLTIHHQLNADYVAYAAATLGNPPTSTLIHALQKGYLHNFPRLTADMVRKNPPNSLASAEGHLSQHKAGIRSTNATKARGTTKPKPLAHRDDLPSLPPATSEGDRTTNLTTHEALIHDEPSHSHIDPTEPPESIHELHSAITSITDGTLHADLTGRFQDTARNKRP